jgi:hypothetical protein
VGLEGSKVVVDLLTRYAESGGELRRRSGCRQLCEEVTAHRLESDHGGIRIIDDLERLHACESTS